MRIPRFLAVFPLLIILVAGLSFAQQNAAKSANPAVLPTTFAGWQISPAVRTSPDPAAAPDARSDRYRLQRFQILLSAQTDRDFRNMLKRLIDETEERVADAHPRG